MPLESPNLDDRDFDDLLKEALQRVKASCPSWTDLTPSDPGVVLLEVFAYLTDLMIYRLNRVPGKAYIEFLRLMGLKLYPPAAAHAQLTFSIQRERAADLTVPAGTRVTVARARAERSPPIFVTAAACTIAAGKTSATAEAYHLERVEAELIGVGSGEPAQSLMLRGAPVIAPLPSLESEVDVLLVGIETAAGAVDERTTTRSAGGKLFRIWREVESFSPNASDRFVYIVDRVGGLVTFAPAIYRRDGAAAGQTQSMGEYPPAGAEIRAWYCRGGGAEGNVTEGSLCVLKDPVPGVAVTNAQPANGGAAAETVENALRRGPQELHSLERAVTARDFEMLARRNAGVPRARAFTEAELWAHATPGTVAVLLVPNLPREQWDGERVSADALVKKETADALARVREQLELVRPLGTRCKADWVRYKVVQVKADVVVYRGENADAIKARVRRNLHEAINPLPVPPARAGWKFGEPLRISRVYDLLLSEPGVNYVDKVRLIVEDAPDRNVRSVVADAHQPNTWHAVSGNAIYRSMNSGDSWERTLTVEDIPLLACCHRARPGYLAVVTRKGDDEGPSRVFISRDCAETWAAPLEFAFSVRSAAWGERGSDAVLYLATEKGLYELAVDARVSEPVQVIVDASEQDLGLWAVESWTVAGENYVAVAAAKTKGVFLRFPGDASRGFVVTGLVGEDARVLRAQRDGTRTFLWAGVAVPGNETGSGCHRIEVNPTAVSGEGWRPFADGWDGGTCHSIAFDQSLVLAATHFAGVIKLDLTAGKPAWVAPRLPSGLPTTDVSPSDREKRIFDAVASASAAPAAGGCTLLAGGPRGIYRSTDYGTSYSHVSGFEFSDKVAIPSNWLLCSGDHQINVLTDHEAR